MVLVKRRDIIRLGAVGGASLIVPSSAWGMPGGPSPGPPEQILGQLLSFGFDFLFGVDIPAPVFDFVINLFEGQTTKVGRAYSIHSSTRGSRDPGLLGATGQALINVGVHTSASGGFLVHGHVVDGGKTAFTHDGTAPNHTHPLMQQHVAAIVGGAHGYFRGTNR
jgi:hypothetical protein